MGNYVDLITGFKVNNIKKKSKTVLVLKNIFKLFVFLISGFLFYKKRKIVKKSILQNSGFLLAAIHGLLLSMIALVYRLIVALNWIIHQSKF